MTDSIEKYFQPNVPDACSYSWIMEHDVIAWMEPKYNKITCQEHFQFKSSLPSVANKVTLFNPIDDARQARLLDLMEKWILEDPDYDVKALDLLERSLAENPLAFRELVIG